MKRSAGFLASVLLASAFLTSAAPALAGGSSDCTIVGTNKSETIIGTSGPDIICALGGADKIYGLGGNDTIRAGSGNDTIFAGDGSDAALGEAGNDTVDGGTGADRLNGGEGLDKINGAGGEDMLQGGAGNDNISGGDAIDVIDGGKGVDTIRTGAGNDVCSSDSSDVRLDSCTIDNKGPSFGALTTEVQQVRAGELAVFAVNVSDVAGVSAVYGSIGGAPGWVTEWCGFLITGELVSGTSKAGTYELRCTVPPTAVNGSYTLEWSSADLMGQASRQSKSFEVTGGSADSRTPQVTRIDLPSSVQAGQTFVITVDATDESQVAGIYVWFLLEGGGFSDENGLHAKGSDPRLVSPSAVEASFEQDYLFGDNAPKGQYHMWLSVRDGVGNREFFDTGRTINLTK